MFNMVENKIINCEVTGIRDYGMFVVCGEYDGLVHISEISDQYIEDIGNIFSIGDRVNLTILEVDKRYKRLKLSYKENHKIHRRIRKSITIKKGFHSLYVALPDWIRNEEEND